MVAVVLVVVLVAVAAVVARVCCLFANDCSVLVCANLCCWVLLVVIGGVHCCLLQLPVADFVACCLLFDVGFLCVCNW